MSISLPIFWISDCLAMKASIAIVCFISATLNAPSEGYPYERSPFTYTDAVIGGIEDLSSLRQIVVVSTIACAQRCTRSSLCKCIVYQPRKGESTFSCLLDACSSFHPFKASSETTSSFTDRWYLQEKVKKKAIWNSCKDVYKSGERLNGFYKLKDIGLHYCILDERHKCRGGGWTLALVVNGGGFSYASSSWGTEKWNKRLNHSSLTPLNEEAKYPAYAKVPFNTLCVGIQLTSASDIGWSSMYTPRAISSLSDTFSQGTHINMTVTSNGWGSLDQSHFPDHCTKQGLNVRNGGLLVRIGIVGSRSTSCSNCCDSVVGVGLEKSPCGSDGANAAFAVCIVMIQ